VTDMRFLVQVELVAVAPGNAAEARCVVALHPEALATELSATNSAASPSPVALSCGVSNHLRVSTPDATYALGLQGSDYRTVEPALSEFSIIPPDYRAARQAEAGKEKHRWANRGFDMVLSGIRGRGTADEPDGEEDDDYKHMTDEMCRVYSQAPREFTILDRVTTFIVRNCKRSCIISGGSSLIQILVRNCRAGGTPFACRGEGSRSCTSSAQDRSTSGTASMPSWWRDLPCWSPLCCGPETNGKGVNTCVTQIFRNTLGERRRWMESWTY
jgi:hypothetical protein